MTQDEIDANQIAFNTPSEQHSTDCPRKSRPTGELFRPLISTGRCRCWVFDAASLSVEMFQVTKA